MDGLLRFSVSEVKEKGQACFKGEVPAEDFAEGLAGEAATTGPVSVDITVRAQGGRIALKGSAAGQWRMPCSRCLAPASAGYSTQFEETFAMSDVEIDGAEEVRQALLLALPMRVFCKDDCKGLCVKCGNNRNVKECGCLPSPFNAPHTRG